MGMPTLLRMKIICLGNEFAEGDSLAKDVGGLLMGEYEVVNVKDSFELMGINTKEDLELAQKIYKKKY